MRKMDQTKIRKTEKRVVVSIPEHDNYYGIRQAARDLYYDASEVAAALKHDGWESLDEIDASEQINAATWLAERCRLASMRLQKTN